MAFRSCSGVLVGFPIALGIFTAESIDGISFFLGMVSMAASKGSVLLILRYVNQLEDDDYEDIPNPPPPSEFKIN